MNSTVGNKNVSGLTPSPSTLLGEEINNIVQAVNSKQDAGAGPNTTSNTSTTNQALGTTEIQLSSVSITPSSTAAKIAIFARVELTKDSTTTARIVTCRIRKGTTNTDTQVGLDSVVRSQALATTQFGPGVILVIDTPNTISPVTYSIRAISDSGAPVVNRVAMQVFEIATAGPAGTVNNNGDTFPGTPAATSIVTLTQVEYDAITTKNANTLYIIV